MAEHNSSLPQINPGDPSDLSRPARSNQAKAFESNLIKPGEVNSPFVGEGILKIDKAPGQAFANNPFGGMVDTPKLIGTKGWVMDITNARGYEEAYGPESVALNLAMTGSNVSDPRLNKQMSNQAQFLNDQMKIWETSGDRARKAVFGGALQGINRIGEDLGSLLGGSFWGEDFERNAMERYFADARATYDQAAKIYDEDAKFWQGTQAVVSSIVEFAPVGGMVTKGVKYGLKGAKLGINALRGTRVTDKAVKTANAITQGTRVSEAVAANSSRLGNFYRKFQNPINQIGTAVPAGIIQNRIEGTAMGLQTYNEVLEELQPLIDAGDMSYEDAAKIASDQANSVRSKNNAMMLQDVFQHATLFRARGLTRTGYQRPGFTWNPKKYLKNAFQSRKSLWNYGTNNFIVQGIGEGLEEGIQSGIQQDAIVNAQRAGREILRETGKDVTKLAVDNLAVSSKTNVLDRYLGYMSTDDAKFEMAVGFFAGAGQRAVQSYAEKAFDGAKYRKITKQISRLQRELPSGTDAEKAYKRQKIEELQYKRSIETEKGRAEAARELLDTLSSDTANSIKFAMETDDLIEAAGKQGMEHLGKGIEKNAFFNLFMKHAANGTVDQLERQLKAIADGSSTSAILPADGSAKQKATEFLAELDALEADYLTVQSLEGAHSIMGKQFLTQVNEKVIDDAFAARSKAKGDVIADLRRLSGSQATSIELDEETGELKITDSLGRNVPISASLKKAMEASQGYRDIFEEGGLNDQINAIKDRVIADRESLAEMLSASGQKRLRTERKEFEKELERIKRAERKRGRKHSRKGRTKGQKDASNIDNQQRRANQSQTRMEGDEIVSEATLPVEENAPDSLQRDPDLETVENLKEAFEPGGEDTDIKTDKENQDQADKDFDPALDKAEYGYSRGKTSNVNKVATLLREWNATVNNGVVSINSADFNFIDGYMALSDPTSVQEGDELIFEVVQDADDFPVTDVSDLDETLQGKKKTVKEARANKKNLAEHESEVSATEISEDQIVKDTQPIKIIHVSADGTRTEIGFVHTPLYQREARTQRTAEQIAQDKQELREFRDKLLSGEVKGTRISSIQATILNYVSKDQRQTTRETFRDVDSSKYTIAVSRSDGQLFTSFIKPDGTGAAVGIKSEAGVGRNSVIINQDQVRAGMAYAIVPLKKDSAGNIHYYAAPLFTRPVTDNNVEVMMMAVEGWLAGKQVPGLQSDMTGQDVRNLKTVLKRFIRVRNTNSLPHKPGQSFVYEKEVNGKKVLVFSKVLSSQSEGNNGMYEVALEKNMPLSEENLAFIKDVLADQMLNMDFDSLQSNEHFFSIVKDGKIQTSKKAFMDHILDSTLSSIAPVRTDDGALPNGRAIFHYNPDVRYGEGVEGVGPQEAPPLRPDDAAQDEADDLAKLEELAQGAGITVEQAQANKEDAELLAEDEDADFDDMLDEDEDDLGLLPESATNRTEETREQYRLPQISALQQEQIVSHFAADIIAQLKAILANARVDRSDEEAFKLAVDEAYSQILRDIEALQNRSRKRVNAAKKLGKDAATIARFEKRAKKAGEILESLRNNEDKLVDLTMDRLEAQSGVTRREGRKTTMSENESAVKSLFDSIFGGKKTKSEELEEDSNEDMGGDAPGINKSYHSDNFYYTLDPIETASSRMRDSLSTLVQINEQGGFVKNFFGKNKYADPNQVFKLLSTALDGTNPIFSEQMETLMRKYLSDRGFRNKAQWLPALVLNSVELKSLEASPLGQRFLEKVFPNAEDRAASIKDLQDLNISPQIMNEFSSVMAKHTLVAPMISIQSGRDGQVYVSAFSQNRNALVNVVAEEFDRGMRSKLYQYDPSTGDYIINEEAFAEGIEYLKSIAAAGGQVDRAEFRQMMETKLGIALSEDAVDALFDDGIYLDTVKGGRRTKITDSQMWGNRSPFIIMQQQLEQILSQKTPYSVKGPTNFGAIKRLVKLEATRSSAKRHGTTFYSGGRNIATMTSNKYFNKLIDELFTLAEDPENPELAENIVNEAHRIFGSEFEKPSQLLKAIQDGLITREDLEVQYINFSPLKQGKDSSDDFNRLQEREHAAVKNGLMTYSTNISNVEFVSSSEYTEGMHTFKMRQATIVPLTMSDKNTVMALKTLVPIMEFDANGNITNNTVNLFVNHVVMSEINRIRAFAASNSMKDEADKNADLTDVNNRAFEEGSHLFYLLPQLNDVMIEFDGEMIPLNEAVAAALTEPELKALMPRITESVKPILNSMIEDKIASFASGAEDYDQIPSAYKTMLAQQSKIVNPDLVQLQRMVAADITLNQALGTANTIQMFVGDVAQYYKPGKVSEVLDVIEEGGNQATNKAAIQETYENLDKRLAALIAPGVEPSRKDDNEEYIQLMVPDIKMDYDAEFFEGLPDDVINQFKGIEATDAQEFITWKEYLDNAVSFGEITQETADQVADLIRKYERGYIMKKEDKDLLKKVMFRAQKPVGVADYYTKMGSTGQTVRQRAYVKTSAVPLLPMFTKGTQLDNVRQAMENLQESQGTNVRLTFKSGVKVGYPAASENASLVNNDGTIKSVEELTTIFEGNSEAGVPYRRLNRKYWRIQQSVPDKKKDESTRGTQPDALIGGAAADVPALKPIVQELTENGNKLFKLRADEIRKELLVDNPNPNNSEKVVDREKLGALLKQVALDRGFDFNVIEGLTVAEDGTFEIPAELSPASEQFQSMLLAIARKGVARKKVTGGSQVLMSEAMFRFEEDTDQGEILYTDKWEGSLKPMRMENGTVQPAQILVPNKLRTPNGKLINFRKYVNSEGRIDLSKLPEGALEGMGFRIPTQGYNSMAVVEIVGFLPEYMGDIVVAPRSFVSQMGSDFDVDKLYDYFFKMEEVDGKLSKVEGDSELGLQNAMLSNRLDILKNEEVYKLIKQSLGFGLHTGVSDYTNSADPDMAKEINFYGGMANAIEAKKAKATKTKGTVLSEFYQRKKYLEARSAMDAVGVKATLNSFVGTITSTDKSINLNIPFTFGVDAQVAEISGSKTLRGTRQKQDVVSGTLSAAVDNQKEQVINKYNLNNETFDAHDALELMGFEEDFIQSFLEQPIIVAAVQTAQKSEFQSIDGVINSAISALLKDIFDITTDSKKIIAAINAKFEAEFGNLTMDEVVAKLYNGIGGKFSDVDPLLNIALLQKFQQATTIMSELRPAIRILSGDAKGAGSTLAEFVGVIQNVQDLDNTAVVDHISVLGLMGPYRLVDRMDKALVTKLEEQGFIPVAPLAGKLYMVKPDSIKAAGSIHTLSVTNDLVMSEFSGMFDLINTISSKASIRANRVENKKIISQGIRSYINSNPALFTEDEVTTTLDELIYESETSMSLAQMVDAAKQDPRLKNNKLIQELETTVEPGRPHTIGFRNSANDDLVTDSQAIAFLDLILSKSTKPVGNTGLTPKELGRKLIDYAFLTGGRKTAVDFVRYVPTSYLIDLGFFKTLKEGYSELKSSEGSRHKNAIVQQLLQHNPDLVRRRVRLGKEGVILDRTDSKKQGAAVFTPQKDFVEEANISISENRLYTVDPRYLYIAVKPANKPRRVLKFDPVIGKYIMLDNLGTGTISEYEFGKGTKESVISLNQVSTYLGEELDEGPVVQEGDPGFGIEDLDAVAQGRTPAAPNSAGTIPADLNVGDDVLQRLREGFEPGGVGKTEVPNTPTEEAIPGEDPVENVKNETEEDLDSLFQGEPTSASKVVPATENEKQAIPSLASIKKNLEGKSLYSPSDTEVKQMLTEISESADMAHKVLALRIITSGVLDKKDFKLVFKPGSITESKFTQSTRQVTIPIDSNTTNWDFEQAVLHEIGHALTNFEIRSYMTNPSNVSPQMRAAIKKLDTIRELFMKKLAAKSPEEIANYIAFTTDKESDIVKKVRELHAAGDMPGIQKLLMAGYGAHNLDEFVTMVMSNQAFRDMLDDTVDFNLSDGTISKSFLVQIMEVLKDMFRQIFDIEKRKISEYAFNQAMFIAKNQVTGTDTGYRDDSEMVTLRNGRSYIYDGSNVIDDAFNVVKDKRILQQVELKVAMQTENLTKVVEDGKTYYVYQGFDKIEVATVSPKGTVTRLTTSEADKIIPKAFQGSDGIITGEKPDNIQDTDQAEDDTNRLLPLQGTVSEFLQELDPAERRFFNQLSKEGKLKTICKTG